MSIFSCSKEAISQRRAVAGFLAGFGMSHVNLSLLSKAHVWRALNHLDATYFVTILPNHIEVSTLDRRLDSLVPRVYNFVAVAARGCQASNRLLWSWSSMWGRSIRKRALQSRFIRLWLHFWAYRRRIPLSLAKPYRRKHDNLHATQYFSVRGRPVAYLLKEGNAR